MDGRCIVSFYSKKLAKIIFDLDILLYQVPMGMGYFYIFFWALFFNPNENTVPFLGR
jgi:hypothetical protein